MSLLRKIADGLIGLSANIGAMALLFVMGVIIVDVIGRAFGSPLYGGHDITTMTMVPTMLEANLAAAQGRREQAIDAIARLPRFGWPWVLPSPGVALTGPLLDDPVWADLQSDPRLVRTLAPVRATIARERAEVAALMSN